ncbi:MAG: SAM-dependent methyltransferase [bacterium]
MAIGRSFGRELLLDPALSRLERLYVRLFGVPILGLRVRAGYVVPLLEELQSVRGSSIGAIADAGCGRGLFAAYCARIFPDADIVGFDFDREQVERNRAAARSTGIENLRFEVQDLTELAAEDAFDLVLSVDNLEHLEDDRGQVFRFRRALRPGGWLLVHVPHHTRNLFGWRRRNFMEIEGHVRPGYTRDTLVALLEEAGLEVVRSGYSYNSMETLANDLSFLVTGGRERRKGLYALAFPALLALAHLGGSRPPREGSGLWTLARRSTGETVEDSPRNPPHR